MLTALRGGRVVHEKISAKKLLTDKKLWPASFDIALAAVLRRWDSKKPKI